MKRKKLEEYIGEKYNHLTITGIDRERRKREHSSNTYVFADCDCGVCNKSYNLAKLKKGETKSCGHLKYGRKGVRKENKIEIDGKIATVYTKTNSYLIDTEDIQYLDLENKHWFTDDYGYLTCTIRNYKDGTYHRIKFHRIIMNAKDGEYVDHKNNDKTDNRKENLRICSHWANDVNKLPTKRNMSGVIGVSFDTSRNKWSASITYHYKNIHLGRFANINDAIKSRLNAEKKYFGQYAPQIYLFEEYGIT